jgi:surface protein
VKIKTSQTHLLIIAAVLVMALSLPSTTPVIAADTDDFVITVKTDNPGDSATDAFTIPTFPGETYNYNVDCNNDGTDEAAGLTGDYTCDYSTLGGAGTYTIRIKDNVGDGTGFPRIYFDNDGDRLRILTVEQWGTGIWTSMESAFYGAANLTVPATDAPNLSQVTSLGNTFRSATSFNQDISAWDVSNVTEMVGMFYNAASFNQDIGGWDTSSLTNTTSMFTFAVNFNQDLSGWDVSGVTQMSAMFSYASAFNQDISTWDTSSLISANSMFNGATAFDQNLGSWDVTSLASATSMFDGVTLSPYNYDGLLQGWAAQSLFSGVTFSGGNSHYCYGEAARNDMITNHGWTITDGGKDCTDLQDFVITVQTNLPGTSANDEFTIPTFSSGIYDYNVDCDGDGTDDATHITGDYTCDYSTLGGAGTYEVRIVDAVGDGTGFPGIYFNNGGDAEKVLSIDQWGTGQWVSLQSAFYGATNLAGQAWDAPDLSGVTNLSRMFRGANAFNQDLSGWDTSTITTMAEMFYYATSFNQPIGGWETGNVTDMSAMFAFAVNFNQDISSWDVSSVTSMNGMFAYASTFNQPIGGWTTSSLTAANSMFISAAAFDQDLGSWDVTSLAWATDMLDGTALSTENYDALLNGWNAQSLQSYVTLDASNSTYCEAEAARANMISNDNWTINDAGKACLTDHFVITVKTDNPGTSDNDAFTIPTHPLESYDYNVDCDNDGTDEATNVTGDYTCDYSTLGGAGTYTVRIKDNVGDGTGFPRIYFNNSGDKDKLLSVDQWGTGLWVSMADAFYGAANLTGQASDTPNLTDVTDASRMFAGASAFNQDISGWNTGNITNMASMFADASSFNQNISAWDVAGVTDMSSMFAGAGAFNQNLGGWQVSALTQAANMFANIALSTDNYDALLIGWDAQVLQPSVTFGGGSSTYCEAEAERDNMINNDHWIITDGGRNCPISNPIFIPLVIR